MKAMPCYQRVATVLAILPGISLGAAPAVASSAKQTDKVVIQSLSDRSWAACGVLHIMVRVDAVTAAGEKRAYYITYCGTTQPLPGVGATCEITYDLRPVSGTAVGESWGPSRSPVRYASGFSCVDPEVSWDGQL